MRRALTLSAVLVLWESLVALFGSSLLFVGPSDVFGYLWNNAGLMSRAAAETLKNAAWGYLWGNLAAITLASIVMLLPRFERLFSALALIVFCLPLVATGPILRVIAGPGEAPQIVLAALSVYYTTYLALLVGLRAIPQSWSDLITLYGRGRLTELLLIRVRASLPYLFVGLQIAAPAAFLGAMIGEFTGAERGMGVLTLRAMRALEADATWSLATVAACISIAVYSAVGAIGRRLTGYAPVILLSARTLGRSRLWWQRLLGLFGLTVLLLIIWQVSMDAFELNAFFAKRPGDVAAYLLTQSDARKTLFYALIETLEMTIPGYLAGLLLGAGLAALLVLLPSLKQTVLPLAVAARAVPIITTAPLIILALGRGAVGGISVVAVMIFFPTLVACLQGLRQTPGQIVDVFASYGSNRVRLLIAAQLPAMLPAFFAAARMAVPAAFLAATTTEWLATGRGVGVLMALTATTSNYNMLWSCVVAVAILSAIGYALVAAIERRVLSTYAREQLA